MFFPLFSRNVKCAQADQSVGKFCYSVWKITIHKPSNVAVAKNIFFSVYVICIACFDECFLFHVYCYLNNFFNCHILAFFETSVLIEVPSLHYLCSNSAILILKLSYNILATCSKLIWFMITFFTLLFLLVTIPHFSKPLWN